MRAFILFCAVILAGGSGFSAADSANSNLVVGDSYQLRNVKFGELLRPRDANSADGTPIVLYPAEPWKCMTWKITPATNGGVCLQNHFTRKTFQVKASEGGKALVQVSQPAETDNRRAWQFTKQPDGTYEISEAISGDALTAVEGNGNSARVVAAPWQDKPEQRWKLEKIDPATLTM